MRSAVLACLRAFPRRQKQSFQDVVDGLLLLRGRTAAAVTAVAAMIMWLIHRFFWSLAAFVVAYPFKAVLGLCLVYLPVAALLPRALGVAMTTVCLLATASTHPDAPASLKLLDRRLRASYHRRRRSSCRG